MKQTCPYITQCKMPKESHRCYDDMKYQRCISYQRFKKLSYDIKHDDLGIGVEGSKLLRKLNDI